MGGNQRGTQAESVARQSAPYLEALQAVGLSRTELTDLDALHPRYGAAAPAEHQEGVNPYLRAAHHHLDAAIGKIAHIATELQLPAFKPGMIPESYSLDPAVDNDADRTVHMPLGT